MSFNVDICYFHSVTGKTITEKSTTSKRGAAAGGNIICLILPGIKQLEPPAVNNSRPQGETVTRAITLCFSLQSSRFNFEHLTIT